MKIKHEFTDGRNTIQLNYIDGAIYVNLTKMGKSFDKDTSDFLQLFIADKLIKEVEKNGIKYEPVFTIDNETGASDLWAIQQFAILFAFWINPALELTLRKCIKHFLTTSIAHIGNTTQQLPNIDEGECHQFILESEYDKSALRNVNAWLEEELKNEASESQYKPAPGKILIRIDNVIIVERLGLELKFFNQIIRQRGIVYDFGGTWLLDGKYLNHNYTFTETEIIKDQFDRLLARIETFWTSEGENFIIDLFSKDEQVMKHSKKGIKECLQPA